MDVYEVDIDGKTYTMRLSDVDAERYGDRAVKVDPNTKKATPKNKKASPKNKAGR